MKLNDVYIGYVGDRERVLYRKCDETNGILYYDIETKRVFDKKEINESTLIPVNIALNILKKRMNVRNIMKLYRSDRNTLIDTNGLYFGSLYDVSFVEIKKGYYSKIGRLIKDKCLYARIDDPEGRSLNLLNGRKNYRVESINEGFAIKEDKAIDKTIFDKEVVPKKKILKKYYRNEL